MNGIQWYSGWLGECDPITDPDRLAALRCTGLLDSPADQDLDQLARLAAQLMDAPVALISLVDKDRQFFKSAISTQDRLQPEREMPLTQSLCGHAVAAKASLVLADARADPFFRSHPAVSEAGFAAYAGLPIVLGNGYAIGTLCVLDTKPHNWRRDQLTSLQSLVEQVALLIADRISSNDAHACQAWLLRGHGEPLTVIDRLAAAIAFYLARLDHYLAASRQTGTAFEDAAHRDAVSAAQGNLWRALTTFDSASAAPGDLREACAAFLTAEQARNRLSRGLRRGEVPLDALEQAVGEGLAAVEAMRVALRDYEHQESS